MPFLHAQIYNQRITFLSLSAYTAATKGFLKGDFFVMMHMIQGDYDIYLPES